MCDDLAVSKEHVPPKCLFPEAKDVEGDTDFRNSLITVPSCDKHNSQKSGDDAFLMYLLVSEIKANEVATSIMFKKLKRATKRNPSLFKKIFAGAEEVTINSEDSFVDSFEVPVDKSRIDSCFDHIARGLFYHETKLSWFKKIIAIPDFIFHTEGQNAQRNDQQHLELSVIAKAALASIPNTGENKEVFSYKFFMCKKDPFEAIAQLEFYKNCVVTLLYVNEIEK